VVECFYGARDGAVREWLEAQMAKGSESD
jgi:hypothetical protein